MSKNCTPFEPEQSQTNHGLTKRTSIESLIGMTEIEVQEFDWPTKDRAKDYFWSEYVPLRGSVRLAAGLIIDREEVAKRWHDVSVSLQNHL